jgi:ADP-glucose pyrophosphorylase
LTIQLCITHVKLLLDKLGVSSEFYNGHSFRIGAPTARHEARLEDHLIQTLSRWSSDRYTRYIHTSPNVSQQAQKQFAETDESIV